MRTACGTALAEFCHYPTSTPPGPSSAGLELTKGPRATPSSLRGLEPNHFWISGLERGVTEGRAKAWAHQTALEDYEIEVVQTLGLNGVDWTDPVETLVALQGLLGEDGIPDEVDCMGLSLAAQAAVGANAYSGIARGPNVAKTIRQMMKRLRRRIQDSSTYKEGPQMAVRRFLQGFELASQGEVRRDRFLAQKGDGEALVRAATQVVPMALEALIEYPALADEMLSLAWEFAVRAVEEQRSYGHHPGALAVRLIKNEGPLLAEARRQGLGLDQESLRRLQKLRKTRSKHPEWVAERYAKAIQAPLDWVQAAMPLLEGVYWLDEGVDDEEQAPRELAAPSEEDHELKVMVVQALKGLERAHGSLVREVVERVCMEGLPPAELAEELGLEDVQPYLQKGLEFLRADPILAEAA